MEYPFRIILFLKSPKKRKKKKCQKKVWGRNSSIISAFFIIIWNSENSTKLLDSHILLEKYRHMYYTFYHM